VFQLKMIIQPHIGLVAAVKVILDAKIDTFNMFVFFISNEFFLIDIQEIYWIKFFDSFNNGMNCTTDGGSIGRLSFSPKPAMRAKRGCCTTRNPQSVPSSDTSELSAAGWNVSAPVQPRVWSAADMKMQHTGPGIYKSTMFSHKIQRHV